MDTRTHYRNYQGLYHYAVLVVAVWSITVVVFGQAVTVIPCQTLPCSITVNWDPITSTPVDGYRLVVDGSTVGSPVAVPVAQTMIGTLGRHTVVVRAFSGAVEGANSAPVTIDIQQQITVPIPTDIPAPTNIRVTLSVPPPSTPPAPTAPLVGSPAGTAVPPATSATDRLGRTWTLSGTSPRVNGVQAGPSSSSGMVILIMDSGVYLLGTDNKWYRHVDATATQADSWQLTGSTKPVA